MSGRYVVKCKTAGRDSQWTFVVQRPSEEADLTPFTANDLANWRSPMGMDVLDPQGQDLAQAVGRQRAGREVWLPLMLAALLLMGVEMWFARWCNATRAT
jgi:hypothetical protein